MATGPLLVRLVFGLLMAAHGSQKIFGWFGVTGTGAFFEQLGFRPGRRFAAAASSSSRAPSTVRRTLSSRRGPSPSS